MRSVRDAGGLSWTPRYQNPMEQMSREEQQQATPGGIKVGNADGARFVGLVALRPKPARTGRGMGIELMRLRPGWRDARER